MRKKYFILCSAIVLFSIASIAQDIEGYRTSDYWVWRNPKPFGGDFTTVELLDEGNIIIGGSHGVILKSTDFGNDDSWNQAIVPDELNQEFISVKFYKTGDYNVGFAISKNELLKTIDKGDNWFRDSSIFTGIKEAGELASEPQDARFISMSSDDSTLYVLAEYNEGAKSIVIARDIEGNWRKFKGAPDNSVIQSEGGNLAGMHHPYYWNKETIYKSTSSDSYAPKAYVPETSTILQVANIPEQPDQFLYLAKNDESNEHQLYFARSAEEQVDLGDFAIDVNSESNETANETTFNPVYEIGNPVHISNPDYEPGDKVSARISVVDQHEVYVFHNELYKFFTQDLNNDDNLSRYVKVTAGNKQGINSDPDTTQFITGIDKVGSGINTNRVLITEGCQLYTSKADIYTPSISREKTTVVEHSRSVYFTNSLMGYIAQSDNPEAPITVTYRTDDGGINWYPLDTMNVKVEGLDKFYVLQDDSYAFLLDSTSKLYRQEIDTVPGLSEPKVIEGVADFFFIDPLQGWYLSSDKKVYLSENNGDEWEMTMDLTDISSLDDPSISINSIVFTNSLVGFIGADGGLIFRTEDGGYSWTKVTTGGGFNIKEIIAVSEDVLYAGSTGGNLFRTYEGGVKDSWEVVPVVINGRTSYDNLYNINFLSEDRGFVVLEEGYITTLDGGESFSKKTTPLGLPIGHKNATPSMFVLDGNFEKYIYSREENTFTSYDYATKDIVEVAPAKEGVGGGLFTIFDGVPAGEISSAVKHTIELNNLSAALTITAPTNFQVSKDTVEENFTTEVVFTLEETTEGSVDVYVRYIAPTLNDTKSFKSSGRFNPQKGEVSFAGKMIISSAGAMNAKVSLRGTSKKITAINNPFASSGEPALKVWPNPTRGLMNIETDNNQPVSVSVYSLHGQMVFEKQLSTYSNSVELNISDLPSGVYLLKVQSENRIKTQKIIKR